MEGEKNNRTAEGKATLKEKEEGKRRLALKFLSGKYAGGIFTLPESGNLIIGRSSKADIILAEEMVSRKHARLIITPQQDVYIEDLQSTNGTFINGERVEKSPLSEGDRILVGTSIMKLMTMAGQSRRGRKITSETFRSASQTATPVASPPPTKITSQFHKQPPTPTMEGVLSEIPLTDLLQMFSSTKKSGVLKLKWNNKTASIYLKDGNIIYASYHKLYDMPGKKALFRLLRLNEGHFLFLPYTDPPEFAQLIEEPPEFLIMEGLRRLDELNLIEKKFNFQGSKLVFNFPLLHPLKQLDEKQLDVFQMLYKPVDYETILDLSPYEDLETAQILTGLFEKNYIRKESG